MDLPSPKQSLLQREFEESAKLWYLGQALPIRYLREDEIEDLKAQR